MIAFRRKLLKGAGVLAFMLFAATASPEDTAPADASGFAIVGTVVNDRTGAPVPNATLHAVPSPPGIRLVQRSVTQGTQRGRGGREGGFSPDGQTARRARPATAAVDEAYATADGAGHFRMALPHAGAWTLTATAHGFGTRLFDEHQGYYASVVLNDEVTTATITFRLISGAALEGTILDEAGEPVERAQVTAEMLPRGFADSPDGTQIRPLGFAMTDDRGHYEITHLEAGSYRVKIVAQPWYTFGGRIGGFGFRGGQQQPAAPASSPDPSLDLVYAPTWFPGTSVPSAAEALVLHAGEEREADVQLVATPAVHLELPLPPPTSAADADRRRNNGIVVTRIASSGFDFATSVDQGTNGTGRSGSLSPGLYQIRRNGFEDDSEVSEIEVPAGAGGTLTLENAHPLIKVGLTFDGPGSESGNLELTLVDTLSGRRITSNQTSERRGRRLSLNSEPAAPTEPSIFAPPGRYAVSLTSANQGYIVGLAAEGAKVEGRYLTVSEGKPRLTVHMGTGRAELGGIVQVSEAGIPVEGAMVVLVPVTLGDPGDLAQTYRDETSTDGSFDLTGITPGKYILIAIDHGWDVDLHDPAALAKYLMHGVALEATAGGHLERRIDAQAP